MVHAGCVFGAGIHLSKTCMSGSFVSVWWNACVHRQDLGLYSHPKELLGNGVRTQVNSKGKIPSIGKILLRGGLNPRCCIKQQSEPNTLPMSYSSPKNKTQSKRKEIHEEPVLRTRLIWSYQPQAETTAHHLISKRNLWDHFLVIVWVELLIVDVQVHLEVGVALDPLKNLTPDRPQGFVGVRPHFKLVHLATLALVSHFQGHQATTECPVYLYTITFDHL